MRTTSKKTGKLGKALCLNAVYLLLCFLVLIPILYALSVSFSGKGAALSGDLSFIRKRPPL